jgi:hypothetical protein
MDGEAIGDGDGNVQRRMSMTFGDSADEKTRTRVSGGTRA